MTTIAVKDAPIIGIATEERLPAMRYKQGGRTVYSVALSPMEIIGLFRRPNPEVKNPGNREIRPKHAADFATYYLDHEKWVVPGLIARAPNIFTFEEGDRGFGVVSFPKRSQIDISILDGQHRILGFHLALDRLHADREKAHDHRNRAMKVEGKGSTLVKEADAAIRAIDRKIDRLSAEKVTVDIQVTDDLRESRQIFFDIADNALGISKSVSVRFDTSKAINRALQTVLEHDLLKNRVEMEVDRLGRNSPQLVSARHVTEIIRSLVVGIDGRVGRNMEKTLNDVDVANKANAFLDMLTTAFPPLKAVELGQILPEQLRVTSLLGSPLMLRVLAGTYFELSANHGFTDEAILAYFKALAPHMAGPVHENSIWWQHAPAETFDLGSYGPNGRRQDSAALTKALWEWAVDKDAFVYADPQPAPEPEPSADEAVIDYSDLGNPELEEKLKAEDVELGIVKKASTKK